MSENINVTGDTMQNEEVMTAEPVTEIEAEPVTEVAAESVAEIAVEPVTEMAAEPVTEVAAEPVTEIAVEPSDEESTARKNNRKALKVALVMMIIFIVFIGFGAAAFVLARNSEFRFSDMAASCTNSESKVIEAPEFTGAWESDDHTFLASSGGIIEIDGKGYKCTWDDKKITLTLDDESTLDVKYKKVSRTLKLWVKEDKSDSVSMRASDKNNPEDICGSWQLGETVISFSDMGDAHIYGTDYSYSADGYEITCSSKSGNEYLFYTVSGDALTIWQPGEPEKKLTFFREGSRVSALVGTWVDQYGTEYIVVKPDGSVVYGDYLGVQDELGDDMTITLEGDKFVLSVMGIDVDMNIVELDGDRMRISIDALGQIAEANYYRVTREFDLDSDEISLLWDMYSPTEAA